MEDGPFPGTYYTTAVTFPWSRGELYTSLEAVRCVDGTLEMPCRWCRMTYVAVGTEVELYLEPSLVVLRRKMLTRALCAECIAIKVEACIERMNEKEAARDCISPMIGAE